jgi:hypothetical protein
MSGLSGEDLSRFSRQGSIASLELTDLSETDQSSMSEEYLIVSHDCDLANRSEEVVEAIAVDGIKRCDSNYTHAKNPRVFHLQLTNRHISASMVNRRFVHRGQIIGISEIDHIGTHNLYVLQRWMASRYSRPAFANEFNSRRRPARESIRKILARGGGEHLSGI